MNLRRIGVTSIVVGLALLSACSRRNVPDVRSFEVSGVVRSPLKDGQLLIEHEAVPDFMPGMTMPFIVRDNARTDAARLTPGDRIHFRFVVGSSSYAEQFEIVGHEASRPQTGRTENGPSTARLKEGDEIPAFSLVDQDNRALTRADLHGHLTLMTFIFTRCPVPEFCPATTRKFEFIQNKILADAQLRAGTRMLSVTLDPEFDRPDVLRAYGEATGADFSTWRFATGNPGDARALARAFSVYSERQGGLLEHTLCTALIDSNGRVIELWRGNGWKVDEILSAITTAMAASPSS